MTDDAPISREIADGVFWLGGCQKRARDGEEIHGHASAFLVRGAGRSALYDTGHPMHWDDVERGLDEALGERPLDYLMPSHTEYPHAGNLRRLMRKYPLAQVVGDVRDYHLFYPDYYVTGRFSQAAVGDAFDLGGRRLVVVPALLRDLPNTLWAYDTGSGSLFVSDGFAYAHFHGRGQCRATSSEYDPPPKHEHALMANETALFWPKYVDIDEYWHRFDSLFEQFPPRLIAPAHGGVIDNPDIMIPRLQEVLIAMRRKGLAEQAALEAASAGTSGGDGEAAP